MTTPDSLVEQIRECDTRMDELRAEMHALSQERKALVYEGLLRYGASAFADVLGVSRQAIYRASS